MAYDPRTELPLLSAEQRRLLEQMAQLRREFHVLSREFLALNDEFEGHVAAHFLAMTRSLRGRLHSFRHSLGNHRLAVDLVKHHLRAQSPQSERTSRRDESKLHDYVESTR